MKKEDKDLILGALDSLAVALTEHEHTWSDGERAIYDRAIELVRGERTLFKIYPMYSDILIIHCQLWFVLAMVVPNSFAKEVFCWMWAGVLAVVIFRRMFLEP